jgi:hypothetical protein
LFRITNEKTYGVVYKELENESCHRLACEIFLLRAESSKFVVSTLVFIYIHVVQRDIHVPPLGTQDGSSDTAPCAFQGIIYFIPDV